MPTFYLQVAIDHDMSRDYRQRRIEGAKLELARKIVDCEVLTEPTVMRLTETVRPVLNRWGFFDYEIRYVLELQRVQSMTVRMPNIEHIDWEESLVNIVRERTGRAWQKHVVRTAKRFWNWLYYECP